MIGDQFKLIRILDAHSSYKSRVAKDLITGVLFDKYKILYEEVAYIDKSFTCKNNILKIINNKYQTRAEDDICERVIKDVFIIQNINSGEDLNIGNNCIQTLVLGNIISNIDKKDFNYINKMLKTTNICLFCHKKYKRGYHKRCMSGKASKYEYFDKDQIINYNNTVKRLKKVFLLRRVQYLFPGITFIRDCLDSIHWINKRTVTALIKFISEHKYFIDNQDKLLNLNNNCIVNTVKRQRRKPSPKQKLFLEKIIKDYDRIKSIDDKNINKKYIQYGYVF